MLIDYLFDEGINWEVDWSIFILKWEYTNLELSSILYISH